MAHADPTHLLATVYASTAEDYARLWSPVIQPMGERLVAAMPLAKTTTVLDIGTGSGALLPIIRAAARKAVIVGIDRVDRMLHLARMVSPATPLAVMDAEQLGLRSSAFDAARCPCGVSRSPSQCGAAAHADGYAGQSPRPDGGGRTEAGSDMDRALRALLDLAGAVHRPIQLWYP